jgi:hypothetical protein
VGERKIGFVKYCGDAEKWDIADMSGAAGCGDAVLL